MAREVKAYAQNGPGITGHREHRTKRGRKKSHWSQKIAKMNRTRILKRIIEAEEKDSALTHVG